LNPRIVITHWVHPEVIAFLERECELISNPTRETWPRRELLQRSQEAQGLMVFMPDKIDEAFLDNCPHIRIVAGAFKGYDNVDVEACTRRRIWFTVVPDLLTIPTAELAIGLLIGLSRNLAPGDRFIRTGRFAGWRPTLYGSGLTGQTLGIVGMGAVGQAIAERLAGFRLEIIYADLKPLSREKELALKLRRVSLGELLGLSQFVILAAPLRPDTVHLVNAETIPKMRKGSFLINVGRGSVVDEKAVAEALANHHLAGYGADVFEMEDWSRPDHLGGIPAQLLRNDSQTLFTPHLGSAVAAVRKEIELEAAENILQALRGVKPHGAVNLPFSKPIKGFSSP
jgi:phosphonate dehydrogenase